MHTQAIRITIELPQTADVQASIGMQGGAAVDDGVSASIAAIDAGPPAAALVNTLGDPEVPTNLVDMIDERASGSIDAIDAGAFPVRLAAEMEAKGPRHPLGHPEMGMLAAGTSPILSREARN